MPTIQQDVAAIREAVYGKDVREAIADGIEQCNLRIGEFAGHTNSVTGNIIAIEDAAEGYASVTVDVTTMKQSGFIPNPQVMSSQVLVCSNKNLNKGIPTKTFSETNNWKFTVYSDDIFPPGSYMLSFHYKGVIPTYKNVGSYTRYRNDNWEVGMGSSFVPLSNPSEYVDQVIDVPIVLEYPYTYFSYEFNTNHMTGANIYNSPVVSDIMFRPMSIADNTYVEHKSTLYTIPNNENENTIDNVALQSGQNVVYCGSGFVHLTYESEKFAAKEETTPVKALSSYNRTSIEDLTHGLDKIFALSDNIDIDYEIYTGKYYIDSNTGSPVSEASLYNYTQYIDVSEYPYLLYRQIGLATTSPTSVGMAFYHNGRGYISGEAAEISQSEDGYMPNLKFLKIPYDAKYARFTVFKDTDTYGDFEIYGVSNLAYFMRCIANEYQTNNVAIRNYNVGELVAIKNKLYRVVSATSKGGYLNTGDNIVPTTIPEHIVYMLNQTS